MAACKTALMGNELMKRAFQRAIVEVRQPPPPLPWLLEKAMDHQLRAWDAVLSVEREDAFPVVLHVDHGPVVRGGRIQRVVESAERSVAIVCVFADGVGVVDNKTQRRSTLRVAHCSISRSPSELPNAAIGLRP